MQVPIFNMPFQKTIFTQPSLHHFNHPFNFPINPYMVSWSCMNINWWLFILLLKFHIKFITLVGEHLVWSVKLLNCGIQQLNYCQRKRLSNKNMKVEPVFYLPTIMLWILSCNNHCHAHIVINKLERTPSIVDKHLIVAAYRL